MPRSTRLSRFFASLKAPFAAVLLCSAVLPASATAVLSIAGTGCISNLFLKPDGSVGQGCFVQIGQGGYTMTGTVTLDVVGVPDLVTSTAAGGANWVVSSYQIQWSGPTSGSFNSHLPGATSVESSTFVLNDSIDETLFSASYSAIDVGPSRVTTAVSLLRYTDVGTWLSDLSFDLTKGLAPGAGARNWLDFSTLSYTPNLATGDISEVLPDSVAGAFLVTSITVNAVPESGTLALLAIGVVALGWTHRRRLAPSR